MLVAVLRHAQRTMCNLICNSLGLFEGEVLGSDLMKVEGVFIQLCLPQLEAEHKKGVEGQPQVAEICTTAPYHIQEDRMAVQPISNPRK